MMTFPQYLLLKTFRNRPKRWTHKTWDTVPEQHRAALDGLVTASYAQWTSTNRLFELAVTDAGQLALIEFDLYCETALA